MADQRNHTDAENESGPLPKSPCAPALPSIGQKLKKTASELFDITVPTGIAAAVLGVLAVVWLRVLWFILAWTWYGVGLVLPLP